MKPLVITKKGEEKTQEDNYTFVPDPSDEEMKKITVLITGAGTATCQSVIKGLRSQKELNVKIVTTDMNLQNAGRYFSDSFHQVPAAYDKNFIPVMQHICKREQVKLLVPIVDYEFEKLSAAKVEFEAIGCKPQGR